MKLNHIWSVLCRESVIDKDTNNLSIFNVFEKLDVNVRFEKGKKGPEVINVPVVYEVVSLWSRSTEQGVEKVEMELEILDPDNKSLKSFFNEIKVPSGLLRMRTKIKVQGMSLEKTGIYKFIIKAKTNSDYEEVARIPLEVRIRKSEKDLKIKKEVVN